MARLGSAFAESDTVTKAILGADEAKKEKGLLYVVPNAQAPWGPVRDFLAAGAAGGWKRVGLGVAAPGDAAKGRVLLLALPGNAAPDLAKGTDVILVRVKGAGPGTSFELNGEACPNAAALEEKAKALHEEAEVFTEGYSTEVDRTPWTVDGTDGSAGGVVTALEVIARAGVGTVRLAGVTRAAPTKPVVEGSEEAAPPAGEAKPAGEKPADEKPPEKPADEKPPEKPKEEEPAPPAGGEGGGGSGGGGGAGGG
jgi:hypothetical protein